MFHIALIYTENYCLISVLYFHLFSAENVVQNVIKLFDFNSFFKIRIYIIMILSEIIITVTSYLITFT